jgi:DGQHR domain-containing protein
MSEKNIVIKCIEVSQPIGTFYIGSIDWLDLRDIAWADIRRIIREDKSEIEQYFGMQRDLSPKRVKEIAQYVTNIDATFPSSIILAINSMTKDEQDDSIEYNNLTFNKDKSQMEIRRHDGVAKIIDGQHRIFGLREGFSQTGLNKVFQLNVTIFVDMDIDDQSMVFATINKAQTKVHKSLVYDLYDFAKTRSPQRTAHNIVRLLNSDEKSPLKDKIKILGKADDAEKETITQATLVESILKYISSNPLKDRDILKRGKKLEQITGEEQKRHFFRNLFILEKDEVIAKVLFNYFISIKNKWNNAWESNSILVKSTGMIAFMKFLRNAYLNKVKTIGDIVSIEDFAEIMKMINLNDEDFNTNKYKPGGLGQSALYKDLILMSGIESD